LSAAMMLEHLGQAEAAGAVNRAVVEVLEDAKVRTRDLGGASSTQEVTDAVINRL
jgi:isocitrate/isopropylmalate dehydrogenase